MAAGLKPLGANPIFEDEQDLDHYLKSKALARKEGLEKYYPHPVGLSENELELIALFLKHQLNSDQAHRQFDRAVAAPRDQIDFLLSQVPEDFAIWKREGNKEWMALIHLFSPNHWDANEKIGKSFLDVHAPIPHITPLSLAAPKMFAQIQARGAVERYAWGVATDKILNHHPQASWQGRTFNPTDPELYIRYERQTLFAINAQLIGFTIKTQFVDLKFLSAEELLLIHQAISGMDEAILRYKGLFDDRDAILKWLQELSEININTEHLPQHFDLPMEQSP